MEELYAQRDWVGFATLYKELYEQANELEQLRLSRLLLSTYKKT